MAPGPRGVGREHAAERRALGVGRVERQPLAAAGEGRLQPGHRDAGLDRGGQVPRLVLEEPAHAVEPQNDPGARRRRADRRRRPAAPGHDRRLRLGREREHADDLLGGAGEDGGVGRAPLDDPGPERDAGEHVRGTDDAAKSVEQRVLHGGVRRPR
ncbi:MAG: hypothetical protein A3E31_04610 [Candidatus Rokubacteria bacterium RIFCSPHIGHO2_12_FULL_73_22]|nr:MAG: hypothetical protein A3E31_04610 [Candidatus Rokubacteria bacterium RIFCSPHIGHO2_12_FULL_73_22]